MCPRGPPGNRQPWEGRAVPRTVSFCVMSPLYTEQSLPCWLPSGRHSADPAPGGTAHRVVGRRLPRVTAATRVPSEAEETCGSSAHQGSVWACVHRVCEGAEQLGDPALWSRS